MIFVSDATITSPKIYTSPKLIAEVPTAYAFELLALGWRPNSTENRGIMAEMTHSFIERCYVFEPLIPLVNFTIWIYGLQVVGWLLLGYVYRRDTNFPIQKIMTLIPILKMAEATMYGA